MFCICICISVPFIFCALPFPSFLSPSKASVFHLQLIRLHHRVGLQFFSLCKSIRLFIPSAISMHGCIVTASVNIRTMSSKTVQLDFEQCLSSNPIDKFTTIIYILKHFEWSTTSNNQNLMKPENQ
jgi:hypothetical protein